MDKEVKDLVRILENQGWWIERITGSGHIKMEYALGGSTTLPSTPSDRKWIKNAWSDIEKVYEKYGRYTPPAKEEKNDWEGRAGLNYQPPPPPTETAMAVALQAAVEKIPNLHPTIKRNREPVMSAPNQEFIINLLNKRKAEVMEELKPHVKLLNELEQINSTLESLTGKKFTTVLPVPVNKTESEKIEKFLKETPRPAKQKRIDRNALYEAMFSKAVENNGEIDLITLAKEMADEFGIVPSKTQSVHTKLVDCIRYYNGTFPDKVALQLLYRTTEGSDIKRYYAVKVV